MENVKERDFVPTSLRLTKNENELWERLAKRDGASKAGWFKRVLREEARRLGVPIPDDQEVPV